MSDTPVKNSPLFKVRGTDKVTFADVGGSKPTVLVIEDNVEMNRFIAEVLAPHYHIVTAFDGQQGLEKALAEPPTLIVSDIMLPKVSGIEMIAQMRQHTALANVPIIVLSAKADEDLKIKLLEQDAQDFLAKPFSERDLRGFPPISRTHC